MRESGRSIYAGVRGRLATVWPPRISHWRLSGALVYGWGDVRCSYGKVILPAPQGLCGADVVWVVGRCGEGFVVR